MYSSMPLTSTSLIGPCGMNCRVYGLLREKTGAWCRASDDGKGRFHAQVSQKLRVHQGRPDKYCFSCDSFPCKRKVWITDAGQEYHMSMIKTLEYQADWNQKLYKEKRRWRCSHAAGTVCVHRGIVLTGKRAWQVDALRRIELSDFVFFHPHSTPSEMAQYHIYYD
jgi:hypothetical protein